MNGFIESLKSIKDDYRWQIRPMAFGGETLHLIRSYAGTANVPVFESVCPLTAAAAAKTGRYYSMTQRDEAGASLGLSSGEIRVISNACDTLMGWDGGVRAAILAALGLPAKKS